LRAYNTNSGTGTVAGTGYKKMIIELLEKANEDTAKRVYKLLEYLYLKEGQE
jgi:hypothetical protein